MKSAILALGLWLIGAQGVVAQACLPDAATAKADCAACNGHDGADTSCCISVRVQDDVDAAVPKTDLPEKPIALEFASVDPLTTSRPEADDAVVRQAALRAEGPPLYLRNSVLLI